MKLTKRELWLMEKSFSAGTYYGSFDEWLEEHVCNEADVRMVLEAEAPDPLAGKVIEAAILHKRSHMSDCQCVLCKAVSAWHIENQKVTP